VPLLAPLKILHESFKRKLESGAMNQMDFWTANTFAVLDPFLTRLEQTKPSVNILFPKN
jgi:hypothetical protein